MDFRYIPNEIVALIVSEFEFNQLIEFGLLNKRYNQLIKRNLWTHLSLRNFRYIIRGFRFKKIDTCINRIYDGVSQQELNHVISNLSVCNSKLTLSYTIINSDIINALRNVIELSFVKCFFLTMDESDFEPLCKVKSINFDSCYNLPAHILPKLNVNYFRTDYIIESTDLKYFSGIRSLVLADMYNVVTDGFEHLANATELYLDRFYELNNHNLQHLRNVKQLSLVSCYGVTNTGISEFVRNRNEDTELNIIGIPMINELHKPNVNIIRNIRNVSPDSKIFNDKFFIFKYCGKVDANNEDLAIIKTDSIKVVELSVCEQIDNRGLKHLSNANELKLLNIPGITDNGMCYLKNIQKLVIESMSNITDDGLKHMPNLKILIIKSCPNITDRGLEYIPNVWYLRLEQQNAITDRGLRLLTNVKIIDIGLNPNITNEGIRYLRGAQKVTLYCNELITDECRVYLTNVPDARVYIGSSTLETINPV